MLRAYCTSFSPPTVNLLIVGSIRLNNSSPVSFLICSDITSTKGLISSDDPWLANIDLDSPSFGAFFKASKKTVKQDIRRLQVNGLADVVSSQRAAQQTSMAAQASASGFKARQTAARYGMYGNLASAGGDLVRAAQGAKGNFFT